MINTAAFESLQRAMKLIEAMNLVNSDSYEEYGWMYPHLKQALEREEAFAVANRELWEESLTKGASRG